MLVLWVTCGRYVVGDGCHMVSIGVAHGCHMAHGSHMSGTWVAHGYHMVREWEWCTQIVIKRRGQFKILENNMTNNQYEHVILSVDHSNLPDQRVCFLSFMVVLITANGHYSLKAIILKSGFSFGKHVFTQLIIFCFLIHNSLIDFRISQRQNKLIMSLWH